MRGLAFRREGDRDPELFAVGRQIERRRHDAEHAVRPARRAGRRCRRRTGSAPKRRAQRRWLRTTTCSWPGSSSAAVNARPSDGVTPNTSKKLAVTRAPVTRSAAPLAREIEAGILDGREAVERRGRGPRVRVIAGRHAARPPAVVLVDVDEPLGRRETAAA